MGNVFWLSKDLHLKPCFHPPLLVQWIKVDQTCLRWILLMSPCMKGTEACHLKGKKIMVKEWYSHLSNKRGGGKVVLEGCVS